ncbi:hypothetical protein KSP40_PGU008125 [Platanthera guangdongensis]|uniref:Uncharacterized protein n=1 Tax=Platanthera guangdongensis TaxID=2320717 RepID=A0ABR2M672_9ASPA
MRSLKPYAMRSVGSLRMMSQPAFPQRVPRIRARGTTGYDATSWDVLDHFCLKHFLPFFVS